MENEIWLDVIGYEGKYLVSSLGRIKSVRTGKLLSSKGQWVALCKDAEIFQILIKRVVATAFIPNTMNFPSVKIKNQTLEFKYAADNLYWGFTSKDFTGETVGRLTVLKLLNVDNKPRYQCLCSCGKHVERSQKYLTHKEGFITSCGCTLSEQKTKHGMSGSLTYIRWSAMKTRATNDNFSRADRYKKRGIGLQESWYTFEAFLEDMGECPDNKHSLDRIDPDKDYCKDNCRWVTQDIQCFNRDSEYRKCGKVSGVCLRNGKWACFTDNYKTFKVFKDAVYHRFEYEISKYGFSNIDLDTVDEQNYFSR